MSDDAFLPSLRTRRLLLRPWRDADLEPFAALNADPEVMACMPRLLRREESDAFALRVRRHFRERGFGLWVVEEIGGESFVGMVGLWTALFVASFTPAVEVGWRLVRRRWGAGYASEAGRAALAFGFGELGLAEIVSFTAVVNVRSWRVMERIGMKRDERGDFEHPALPPGHRLRAHVLYRADSAWLQSEHVPDRLDVTREPAD